NCLGYVRTRTIVDRMLEGAPLDLKAMMREPQTVTPELKALDLMAMFRRARPHIAIVTDEYGSTLGLVTPTDVLETIAVDLATEVPTSAEVVRREDGSWLVDAHVELQDLERELGAGGLATGSRFQTLASLMLDRLQRIPQAGEVVIVGGWRVEVV